MTSYIGVGVGQMWKQFIANGQLLYDNGLSFVLGKNSKKNEIFHMHRKGHLEFWRMLNNNKGSLTVSVRSVLWNVGPSFLSMDRATKGRDQCKKTSVWYFTVQTEQARSITRLLYSWIESVSIYFSHKPRGRWFLFFNCWVATEMNTVFRLACEKVTSVICIMCPQYSLMNIVHGNFINPYHRFFSGACMVQLWNIPNKIFNSEILRSYFDFSHEMEKDSHTKVTE